MQKNTRALSLLFGIGCLMLIAGGAWLYQNTLLLRTGVETQGIVLQNIPRARGYTAQVEFLAEDGQTYQFLTQGSTAPPLYQPQERVPVFYDASDPSHATVRSFFSIFFGPCMLLLTGIIQCILAKILPSKNTTVL